MLILSSAIALTFIAISLGGGRITSAKTTPDMPGESEKDILDKMHNDCEEGWNTTSYPFKAAAHLDMVQCWKDFREDIVHFPKNEEHNDDYIFLKGCERGDIRMKFWLNIVPATAKEGLRCYDSVDQDMEIKFNYTNFENGWCERYQYLNYTDFGCNVDYIVKPKKSKN